MFEVDRQFLSELDGLLRQYEDAVEGARTQGLVSDKTAHTYILHSTNFVRWIKGDFVPGARNTRKPSH